MQTTTSSIVREECPSWNIPIHGHLLPKSSTPDDETQLKNDFGLVPTGIYPLRQEHFARLLGADSGTVESLFKAVFDTDRNGLVDAFEVMYVPNSQH